MATKKLEGGIFLFKEGILDSHILNLFHGRQRNLVMMNFGATASVSICIGILWSQMRPVLGTWEWEIFGFQCIGAYIMVCVLELLYDPFPELILKAPRLL